jgi:CDP-diacylglycerol--glycerol-3-phosphate 3-phosphatidyltransferase
VNLPNQLTVLRLILTFVFVGVMSSQMEHRFSIAFILFVIASITDFLDGYIARKHNLITDFGKLMDPLADKVLMCGGFVLLVELDMMPGWVVVAILAREFLMTGLRLVAAAEGKVLAAENLGKHKTVWQIITVLYFLLALAASEPLFGWLTPFFDWKITSVAVLGQILIYLSLALTILSGWNYIRKNRGVITEW